MKEILRLRRDETALLIVDVQEKLVPAMFEAERVVRQVTLLARAARQLQLPIALTEQNPSKLGGTIPMIADVLGKTQLLEKMRFSAASPETVAALQNRKAVILCGLETHICVLQTALDLRAQGLDVFVPANAVSSRYESDKTVGIARLGANGCVLGSTEMFIYELLEAAGTDEFRALLPHLK
ncbi:MAG TPA: isochorismatase family protein [Abditibacteriaceae bacterium]|jgi:nicotinamidase-related amidase